MVYINCAPDILSIDSMELMPQATRFSIERAGDVLYQSANSSSQGTSSETLTYTRALSFQGVTLCASFDKASLAADFRVTLSLMVAALLFFFVLFIVLAYLLARYQTYHRAERTYGSSTRARCSGIPLSESYR